MLRSLLVYLGLHGPRSRFAHYLTASSAFGAVPVAAFFAWKYRDVISDAVQRFSRMPTTEA